jgi:Rieske Fe-S protein
MEHEETPPERRTFLKFLIHSMSAVLTVVLGAPVLAYLIDPLNRPKSESGFRTIDGIVVDELEIGQPKQGWIRNVRRDAWCVHPNDVIGRVWVVKERGGEIKVFTTVCPHLGCSINATPPEGFACPCHGAQFKLDGSRIEGNNPAPRGMDSLESRVDPDNSKFLQVVYENFKQGEKTKIART